MGTLKDEQSEAAKALGEMCTTAGEAAGEAAGEYKYLLVHVGKKLSQKKGLTAMFGFIATPICLLVKDANSGQLSLSDIDRRRFVAGADEAASDSSGGIALLFTEGAAVEQMNDLLSDKLALLSFSKVFENLGALKSDFPRYENANALQMNTASYDGSGLFAWGIEGVDRCRCTVWINDSQNLTEGHSSSEEGRFVTITPLSEHSLSAKAELLQVIPSEWDAAGHGGVCTKYFLEASAAGLLRGPYTLEDGEPKEVTEGPLLFGDHVRRAGAQDLVVARAGAEDLAIVLSQDLASDPDIDELVRRVQAQRPSVSRVDAINCLICLTQGYITTFAGLPGTGKSSLCRILGHAMGLDFEGASGASGGAPDAGRGRFVDVSVERGWSSYRDYIGYWNPLINRVERANSDVWDALCLAGERPSRPYVLMLDEANLSPLEHYWSPFLRACDDFARQGCTKGTPRPSVAIDIGAPKTAPAGVSNDEVADAKRLSMSCNTRFLATVNTDWTTEELSPRFLDRSWVIKLDAPEAPIDLAEPHEDAAMEGADPVSYGGLLGIFGARPVERCNLSERELVFRRQAPFDGQETLPIDVDVVALYVRLLECCREHGRPVSPRSQKMMLNYIGTATELMVTGKCEDASDKFIPLDLAFAQKVLPSLSGTDGSIGGLLKALSGCSIAGGISVKSCLPRTSALLKGMISGGESDGCYSFFK